MPSSPSTSCAGLLHDLGARIVVLVNPVTKAHQAERIVLVLGAVATYSGMLSTLPISREHVERRFVGAAMSRAPQAGDAGCDTGERVGTGGACQANSRGRGVLFVVGVQDEDRSMARDSTGLTLYSSHGTAKHMRRKFEA
jgi:hypothetical protein